MIASIIYAIIGCIEALLGLRFVFLLIGANPANGFVNWVYDWSTTLIAPFTGILGQGTTVLGEGLVAQSVIDWTTLIAFIIYGVIGSLIARAALRATAH